MLELGMFLKPQFYPGSFARPMWYAEAASEKSSGSFMLLFSSFCRYLQGINRKGLCNKIIY